MVVNHDPRGRILPGGSLGSFLFILSYDSIQNNPETSKCVYFRSSGLSINIMDTQYGAGSSEYIVKAFRYYSENNFTENN